MGSQILRSMVIGLLSTPVIQQIDFILGDFHINYSGFMQVLGEVVAGTTGAGGIDVTVREMDSGVEAVYSRNKRALVFPDEYYGVTPSERFAVVHECVHAIIDIGGPGLIEYGGPTLTSYPTHADNEAAAYVAGALFNIYAYFGEGYPADIGNPIFAYARKIATEIKDTPGAHVSMADAMQLEMEIVSNPNYDYNLWAPDRPRPRYRPSWRQPLRV